MTSLSPRQFLAPIVALAFLLLGGTVSAAPADARAQARRRFDEGVALVDRGDLTAALRAFEEAYALEPNPAVLYNIAQALRALDRSAEALKALERYRATAALDPARQAAVDQQLRELREKVARQPPPEPVRAPATGELELRCLATGARVFADGRWLGEGPFQGRLTVPEGLHEVRFESRNHPVELRSVRVGAGQTVSQTCTLPIPPPAAAPAVADSGAPAPARGPGPIITAASGGALLGGALAVHLWNDSRHKTWQSDSEAAAMLDDAAPSTLMRKQELNGRLADIHRTDKMVVGLAVAGGLLVSVGLTWWLTRLAER